MTNKTLGIALVVIIAIAIGGYMYPNVTERVVEKVTELGANPGPYHTERQFFKSGSTNGGRLATSSVGALTTQPNDFNGAPTYIDWTPNVLDVNVSLTGTSTKPYVPEIGDTAVVYIRNASTTANAALNFSAADAGLDLQYASSTTAVVSVFGLDYARVTFIRESANLVTALWETFLEQD